MTCEMKIFLILGIQSEIEAGCRGEILVPQIDEGVATQIKRWEETVYNSPC